MSTRENLIKWGIDIHNVVNEMKDKPIVKYIEARRFIDTNVQCKPKIKEVVKDFEDTPSYLETFADSKQKVEESKPVIKKPQSCLSNNMNVVYGMIGLLVALVFIAVVYKKK